jgi:hypothetical protein
MNQDFNICKCGREMKLVAFNPAKEVWQCDFCKVQKVVEFNWVVVR